MLDTARSGWNAGAWTVLVQLGESDGSAGHPHVARLRAAGASARDLSDAVHALCAVHGHHPGMAADARATMVQPDADDWLEGVASGFATERSYMAQLAAAAGPLPSTPGQAESEAALLTSRHALEMLARSERRGCAAGAVGALVHDWAAIRALLDQAAARFGIDVPRAALPDQGLNAAQLAQFGGTPATERAVRFGAQQLFAQHRALWDLLEARASAREG